MTILTKAQIDALVIDGDGHDEDVIALFAHARESLTVLVEVREIAKRIDGQEGAELRDILALAEQPEDVPAATYDKIREEVSSAPTEPTSAENELEFDDGMNEGEGQREPEAPITEDVSASAPVALSPHIYDDALMDNAALKAEVARLEADNTAIGEDQEAMSKQLAEAESHADDLNVLVLEQADKITLLRAVAEAAEGFVACMDSLNHAGEVDGIADSQQMALSPP